MVAVATPFDDRGSENGSVSVAFRLGIGRHLGKGGKGSSKPKRESGSSSGGESKCDMANVPSRADVAAEDVSLFVGLKS